MCELVAFEAQSSNQFGVPVGWKDGVTFEQGTEISGLDNSAEYVFQCWHPEEQVWSTMLPPVEGMAWKMPPGSKIRTIRAEDAPPPAPSMVEQVEAVKA